MLRFELLFHEFGDLSLGFGFMVFGFMVFGFMVFGFMVIFKGLVAQKDFLHDFFGGLWRFLRNHHKPPKKSRI